MKVLVLSNGQLEEKEINNTLEELQKIVGGYIEIPLLGGVFKKHNIDTIINEEGKYIKGLKPEIALINSNTKQVLDVVYGNCIFASHDAEGNTIGLTAEQLKVVKQELHLDITLTYQDIGKEFVVKALFM